MSITSISASSHYELLKHQEMLHQQTLTDSSCLLNTIRKPVIKQFNTEYLKTTTNLLEYLASICSFLHGVRPVFPV